MRGLVASILGLGLTANGLTVLAVPVNWYAMVPGVVDTGPFNLHFVRDIGGAYFVTGAALVWFAKWPTARSTAQAGAAFLVLHTAVHLWDAASGREHALQLLFDAPTAFLPPVLALWIAWSPLAPRHNTNEGEER